MGGTFTDIVIADDLGHVWTHKLPSTPPDFETAVLRALEHLLAQGVRNGHGVEEVAHGTTVATNAVLEHRGARTALITTRGFRDVLELRRIRCPEMYNLGFRKPPGLIERYLRFEVTERVSATGDVLIPLRASELDGLKDKIEAEQVESVAVCLLHSYAYPQHEQEIGEFLRTHLPHVEVSLSSEILRERKEYERTATAVVNAYVRPVMRRYLTSLTTGLERIGVDAPLFIMQSFGGLTPAQDASLRPVYVLESGPAAGVLAAEQCAKSLGLLNVITLDMGGTTAKASMIEEGKVSYSPEYEVGSSLSSGNRLVGGAGELIHAPSIDIAEVGAGGGSVAYVDRAGGLHVGSRSSGAVPGPACYQRGGTEPTVTDANVVLGYIRPGMLADGAVTIDPEAARRAIADKIAGPLGLDLLQAAEGIHRVANARMMRALAAVSTQRGRDPRHFMMIAFGGSGPIHAANLAQELGVRQTRIPSLPGLFSAIGLLSSPVEHHDIRSCMLSCDQAHVAELQRLYEEMKEAMIRQFGRERFATAGLHFTRSADIRFQGQSSEVRISFEDGPFDQQTLVSLREKFEREYERLYGHLADSDNPLEIIGVRMVGSFMGAASYSFHPVRPSGSAPAARPAYFGPQWGTIETPIINRQALADRTRGPLLIDEYDSTIVVPPFMEAHLDERLNVVLEPRDV